MTGVEVAAPEVYRIPTPAPEADGTLEWDATTLVVARVRAGDAAGLGWTYGPGAVASFVAEVLAPSVSGRDPMNVADLHERMRRGARNALVPGVGSAAISAVDIALWDLKARILGVPLTTLLGRVRDTVALYGSGGFTSDDDARLREQLSAWVEGQGIRAVKMKIAEARGSRVERDIARMRIARDAVGTDVGLFVDANGGYTAKQAIRVARHVSDLGLRWFEEPVSSDDVDGLARVRDAVGADVAAGEYGHDAVYFRRLCQAGAVDCLQADATRCGGYTGFAAAASVAAAFGLEISAHTAPLAHLPIACATTNLRHVEWFADHVRVERLCFDGITHPVGGRLPADTDAVGHGLTLRDADVSRYRVA